MTDSTLPPGAATEPARLEPGRLEPDGAPRIALLDILRGIAILGILFMNVNDMGQSFSGPDIRHFGWTAADQIAWWIRAIVADGTARALLEMLFGAGMMILTDRIATGAARVWQRYYARNLVLWLFGLLHIFVFMWGGDILHTYGIAALVAFWFRRLRPRWLLTIGLLLATVQFGAISYFAGYAAPRARAEVARVEAKRASGTPLTPAERTVLDKAGKRAADRAKGKQEEAQIVAAEDRARSGTAATWFKAQVDKSIERLGFGEIFAIWEAAGTMLIGAALFKLGILQGERSRRLYWRLLIAAYGFGFGMRAWAAWAQTRFDDTFSVALAFGEYARIATTLGHVALVVLVAGTVAGARALKPFVAAGRTALTIYVLQTIICLWVLFPPFALGLYGQFGWASMMLLCIVINAALLWWANWWVRRYDIAPVEWAWRSLVERRALPWRRGVRAAPVGAVPAAA